MRFIGLAGVAVMGLIASWEPADAQPYSSPPSGAAMRASVLEFERRLDEVKVDFVRKRRGRRGPVGRAYCRATPSNCR